ncbi:MAG: hypothetical protein ACE5RJ_01575 [Nitrosopumilaceae archaeon]
MIPSQNSIQKLEGQVFTINQNSKVIILELRIKFERAGILLNWPGEFGKTGFGINKSICNLVIGSKYKLLIRYKTKETSKEYWINYDKLRDFIKHHKSLFRVNMAKEVRNIPCNLFTQKPTFSGSGN